MDHKKFSGNWHKTFRIEIYISKYVKVFACNV